MQPKFVPKDLKTNVNVSSESLIKKSFKILASFSILIIFFFLISIFSINLIANFAPLNFAQSLGKIMMDSMQTKFPPADEISNQKIAVIFDKLTAEIEEDANMQFVLLESEDFKNAMTLPGGYIAMTTGFLDLLETENQVAMILAHEIGHHMQRHPMKRMGTGLVGIFFSWLTSSNFDSKLFPNLNHILTLKYSRSQESEADIFALNLLVKSYGHAGGASEAFSSLLKMEEGDGSGKLIPAALLTHPKTETRIKTLKEVIAQRKLKTAEQIPLY